MNALIEFIRDHFARIEWAWALLAVPPAIAAYVWARRQRAQLLASLGEARLVSRLLSTVNTGARTVRAVFAVLTVAGISVALLRPQHGGVAKVIPAQGLDIVLAVDYSKSMLVDDVYPSRIERLEAELSHFVDDAQARGDHVGVVVFAGEARGLPLTSDMRLLQMYLRAADPRTENPGGTAIGKALKLSVQFLVEARRSANGERLKADADQAGAQGEASDEPVPRDVAEVLDTEADQVIILLTDGEDNASSPLEVADEAAKVGIRVFTVGIGSKSGQPVIKFNRQGQADGFVTDAEGKIVTTRLDEETLKQIAKVTGGEYVHVSPDAFGLDVVREKLAGLAAAQREDNVEIEREESFPFVVLPCLVLLSLALGMGDRRRPKQGARS